MSTLTLMERLYILAIWDNSGAQWMPLYGYDGRVEAYAPAHSAIGTFHYNHFGVRHAHLQRHVPQQDDHQSPA